VLFTHVVKLPNINTPLSSRIKEDKRFIPYFNNCLNALNSTYIYTYPRFIKQAPFKNRYSYLLYNVLAIHIFNLQFYYIYLKWEGLVND
jgi:hypothetical protein